MTWLSGISLPGSGRPKPVLPRHCLLALALLLSAAQAPGAPDDFTALCADRTAVERVYYHHRLGNKPPFEQLLPPATIQKLVRQDLQKEAVLKKVYGLEITPAQIDAEVRRINATTRAPDILADLKSALGNDPARFAQTVVKPDLVGRELHEHFENDDILHAPQRAEIETVRARLLAAKARGESGTNLLELLKHDHANEVSENIWQLGTRPADTNAAASNLLEIQKQFGPNGQVLSSPEPSGPPKFYFADLPEGLQSVLRTQLRQADDISAVIEMPAGFLLYLCEEKTAQTMAVAALSVPKRSYEAWLAEQTRGGNE
jgi:hypothetical protein